MNGKIEKELAESGLDIDSLGITDEEIFRVHMLNIVTGILMILIGGILVFRTRKVKNSGKRAAGWILIALGIMVTLTHIMQMLI